MNILRPLRFPSLAMAALLATAPSLATTPLADQPVIVGEYHDSLTFADLRAILEPTHVVEQWSEGPVGLFGAVLR